MLGAPTWRRLGGEVRVSSRLCVFAPGSEDVLIADNDPGVSYLAWVGYQFLLGTKVGKLLLSTSSSKDLAEILEHAAFTEDGIEKSSDIGMVCVGDFDALHKLHVADELLDRCKACSSNNEQAGIFDGVGVVSTMCMRPSYHVVKSVCTKFSALLLDFTRGM